MLVTLANWKSELNEVVETLKFSRNLIHSRVNPVPKLEEEEVFVLLTDTVRQGLVDYPRMLLSINIHKQGQTYFFTLVASNSQIK